MQIKNRTGDQMIQVQNGRLHFNWLGSGGGNYPRYEVVRAGFSDALIRFKDFVATADVGQLQPNQWEVTYINQIPQGTIWQTPADWKFFEPLCSVPSIDGLVAGEDFTGEWHFVIPGQRGRLHIEWRHALSAAPDHSEREIVQLTLTARGPLDPKVSTPEQAIVGLDLGHETIVRSFAALMNRSANSYWGLKNAGH
jgi:hypothetical protein